MEGDAHRNSDCERENNDRQRKSPQKKKKESEKELFRQLNDVSLVSDERFLRGRRLTLEAIALPDASSRSLWGDKNPDRERVLTGAPSPVISATKARWGEKKKEK